jgi:two-component system, NarL family, sensor histidine kinase UhpB
VRSRENVPLHLRLVLANGIVLALAVLAMSLAPAGRHGPVALGVLVVGLALVFAVNTRHLRQALPPLLTTIGTLRARWEGERRAQTARSLASREYDSRQMAAQLHDNVGEQLSAALVELKKAIDHAPPELADELKAVRRHAQLGLVEVRRIGRRLLPEILDDLGLHDALSMLLTGFAAKHPGVRVSRQLEGMFGDLSPEAQLVVYRVAEEALTNVGRHARASLVEMSLRREGDLVVLRVADDGVGIRGNGERTGILGMRERAALVGARISIGPRDGVGTEVLLEVPA